MPTLKEFKAFVKCDDTPLEEFGKQVNKEGDEVTCWIASEIGKRFTIHWERQPAGVAFTANVFVDGTDVGKFLTLSSFHESSCLGARLDAKTMKSLIFARMDLTEEEGCHPHEDALGTIAIVIKQCCTSRTSPPSDNEKRPLTIHDGPWNEKSKKLGGHRVKLGSEIDMPQAGTDWYEMKPYDPANPGTHVTFKFNYRPLAYLQVQGIVPNPDAQQDPIEPPSSKRAKRRNRREDAIKPGCSSSAAVPSVLNAKPDVSIFDDEEREALRELQKKSDDAKKELETAMRNLKRKRAEQVPDVKQEALVKFESGVGQVFGNGEVIDLTSD